MTNDFDIMTDDELYPVEKNLVYLPVEDIYPHPDNPRKDLGDLTELIDSIKSQGILQNLTVVPGHYEADGHYISGYTVIIGHRRLAAAKEAGIATVPAVIADMTFEEQIATMMTENMQRNDLTMYEQAQGFRQLSLMGWKDEDISSKTGFSKKTIGKRLRMAKLAELNKDGMKEAVGRGATLEDILEIEKLQDPEQQEKMFCFLGTPEFKNALRRALDEEKFKKVKVKWIESLERQGAKEAEETALGANYVKALYSWNADDEIPTLKEGHDYIFINSPTSLYIYDLTPREQTPEQIERENRQAEIDRQDAELREISKRHRELRKDFIREEEYAYFTTEQLIGLLIASEQINSASYYHHALEAILDMFGIDDERQIDASVRTEFEKHPKKTLLTLIASNVDTGAYYKRTYSRDGAQFEHVDNKALNFWYDILRKLGYEMSEEEKIMQKGEHPYLMEETENE